MKIIETDRMILRPLTIEDAHDVFEWASDPIVNRYMPYPLHNNVQQAEAWIGTLGDKNEFGFCLKDSGKVIAKCGFQFDRYGILSKYDGSEIFEASYYKLHLE